MQLSANSNMIRHKMHIRIQRSHFFIPPFPYLFKHSPRFIDVDGVFVSTLQRVPPHISIIHYMQTEACPIPKNQLSHNRKHLPTLAAFSFPVNPLNLYNTRTIDDFRTTSGAVCISIYSMNISDINILKVFLCFLPCSR